jgi:sugar phosphate isomerase/epimerase
VKATARYASPHNCRTKTTKFVPLLSRPLTEMAAQRGIGTTIEMAPGMTIGDPPTVLAAIAHVDRPDLRLTVDTMHWVRSGYGASDLHELGPEKIGYVQLCDTIAEAAREVLYVRSDV